jgi:hypothetical protein
MVEHRASPVGGFTFATIRCFVMLSRRSGRSFGSNATLGSTRRASVSGSDEGEASGRSPYTMMPEQCRAGRALIDWSVADLAAKVGLDEALVRGFEGRLSDPPSGQIEALRSALVRAGVIFTDDGSAGVRLGRHGTDEGTRLEGLTTENDR